MARKRFIDPNFWTDIEISKLTPMERLLFIGCFSNADDEGRLPGNPAYLRSAIFPYDDISLGDIQGMRDNIIEKCKNLVIYEVDGNEFLAFRKWSRYQSPRYPKPSQFPAPPTEEPLAQDCNQIDASVQPNDSSLSEWDGVGVGDQVGDQEGDEGMSCASSAAATSDERECLKILKKIKNYPFDYPKDLEYLRSLAVDFPTVDLLTELKKWKTYKLDHPLKKGSNARLQIRNWFENALRWNKDERASPVGQTGQPDKFEGIYLT